MPFQVPGLPDQHLLGEMLLNSASSTPRPERDAEGRQTQASPAAISGTSTTRPPVPAAVNEYFLPNNLTLSQAAKAVEKEVGRGMQSLVYQPVLLAQARVLLVNRKYDLDYEQVITSLVRDPDRRGSLRWENYPAASVDFSQLANRPEPDAHFKSLEMPLTDARLIGALEKDFAEWIIHSARVTVKANEDLNVYAGPDISHGEFRELAAEAAASSGIKRLRRLQIPLIARSNPWKTDSNAKDRELDQDETKHSQRKMEEMGSAAESIFGLFTGRKSSRRVTSTLSKRRMTAEAKAAVQESVEVIEDLKKQIAELDIERSKIVEEIETRWSDTASQVEEITVTPLKKDIIVDLFGIAWFPYYLVGEGDQASEFPAYQAG